MSEAELRAMVREVLREALAGRDGGGKAAAPQPPARGAGNAARSERVTEPVRLASDADLAAFVRRLAALMTDPASAAAIKDGRHRFTLEAKPPTVAAPSARPAGESSVTALSAVSAAPASLTGTITEAKVARLAHGAMVTLAPGAVVTPLARDRARAMGITIQRRR